MSLRTDVIDRLFRRLAATYGAEWDRSMGTTPLADVKTVWAGDLACFGDNLSRLAWAIENLPERAPNVRQFKALCHSAPAPDVPRLEAPRSDPARVAAELVKLAGTRATVTVNSNHGKEWAHRILANRAAGLRVNPAALVMAKAAVSA